LLLSNPLTGGKFGKVLLEMEMTGALSQCKVCLWQGLIDFEDDFLVRKLEGVSCLKLQWVLLLYDYLSSFLSTLLISNKGILKKLILNYTQLVNAHQMQTFHLATSKPILRNKEIDTCKGFRLGTWMARGMKSSPSISSV
jgi:hypothetical protein